MMRIFDVVLLLCSWFASLPGKCKSKAVETKIIAQHDPRTILHSIKVALSLTLVSLFYYLRPLYDAAGVSAMSAVLTVLLLFEFTVGATLSKVVNRGVATILACALGVGLLYIASFVGDIGKPILVGFTVFIISTTLSLARFWQKIRDKYDIGVLVFMMTFISVTISGYRGFHGDENILALDITYHKLFTIGIGSLICVIVSISISPVWAGDEVHNLVAFNMEMLATLLQEIGNESIIKKDMVDISKAAAASPFRERCKLVVDSISIDETMVSFVTWEPAHGRFKSNHPWNNYVEIGNLLRKCAYHVEALYIHVSRPIWSNNVIKQACTELGSECGKTLHGLAISMMHSSTTTPSSSANISNITMIGEKLENILKTSLMFEEDVGIMDVEVIRDTTLASILNQIINCTQDIVVLVQQLPLISP